MSPKMNLGEPEVRTFSPLPATAYVEDPEMHPSLSFQSQMSSHDSNPQVSLESAVAHNQHIDFGHSVPFNHWAMDLQHYESSMSGSPSISGSELYSPPPQYTESQPVYHLLEQPLPFAANNMVNNQTWSTGFDDMWHNHVNTQLQLPAWTARDQSVVPPSSASLDILATRYQQLEQADRARLISQSLTSRPAESTAHDSVASTSDSDSDMSDSEDEDTSSDYAQQLQHQSNHYARHKDVAGVLKLGKWSTAPDSLQYSEQRHFHCQHSKYPDAAGRWCNKRFVRPEHLRRHQKTVHGSERNYVCKVPGCNRHFSRGDNLRDHYWTHISRGGRAGKNAKMSLAELKAILGPKEKRLIKRLKQRLSKTKVDKFKVKSRL